MHVATGLRTKKIYAMGNSKNMLIQRLNKKYPYNQQLGHSFPEPLVIVKKEGI